MNNPVNMADSSGFRPLYTAGEETDAMREASLAAMARAAINKPRISTETKNRSSITRNEFFDTGKNAIKNIGVSYAGHIASSLSEPSKLVFNRAMNRAGQYILNGQCKP